MIRAESKDSLNVFILFYLIFIGTMILSNHNRVMKQIPKILHSHKLPVFKLNIIIKRNGIAYMAFHLA